MYHRDLSEARDNDRRYYAGFISNLNGQTSVLDERQKLAQARVDGLDLAIAMLRAEIDHNRLTNRVKRVLFRRIF